MKSKICRIAQSDANNTVSKTNGKNKLENVHFNIKPQLLNYVTTLKSLFVQNNLGTKTRLKAIKNDVPSYVTFHLPLDIAGS